MVYCGNQCIQFRVFILIEIIKVAEHGELRRWSVHLHGLHRDSNRLFVKGFMIPAGEARSGLGMPETRQQGAWFPGSAQEYRAMTYRHLQKRLREARKLEDTTALASQIWLAGLGALARALSPFPGLR